LANRWRTIGIISILALTVLGSVGLYLFARDPYSEREIRFLIDSAYNHQRPGGGRLFAAAYTPLEAASANTPDIGKAQILLLRYPNSKRRQYLQGLVYLAAGQWQSFVQLTNDSAGEGLSEPALINNLGASYLALAEKNPSFLLKAFDLFEKARALDPGAAEPLFNLVVTYRKLQFWKI
jgi:hypothetical protein